MSKSILANLNLEQSLEEFKEIIIAILKLENVSEWNGVAIKNLEQQIKSAALILTGQCIALLLHRLS